VSEVFTPILWAEHFQFVQSHVSHFEADANCLCGNRLEVQFAKGAPVLLPTAEFPQDASLGGDSTPDLFSSLAPRMVR
jgi:hypothetical protein